MLHQAMKEADFLYFLYQKMRWRNASFDVENIENWLLFVPFSQTAYSYSLTKKIKIFSKTYKDQKANAPSTSFQNRVFCLSWRVFSSKSLNVIPS